MGRLGLALALAWTPALGATDSKLAFRDDGQGNLVFNTGVVKGSLKKEGLGDGLKPISFCDPAVSISHNHGLLVPYRFLTTLKRYGFASWEWPRTGKVLDNGAAELRWLAATNRPFVFSTTYRWKTADTLDMTVAFTPNINMEKFELFLGSYFRAFTKTMAYVQDAGNGRPGFLDAPKNKGGMQLFPRNEEVMSVIKDGRWKYPPLPNDWSFRNLSSDHASPSHRSKNPAYPAYWSFRPAYQAPLGMRQEPKSGVTVLLMAPPADCIALSMTQQEAWLGAFYLNLWGKDVRKGQTLTSRPRLVFGRNLTEEQAVQEYAEYLTDLK